MARTTRQSPPEATLSAARTFEPVAAGLRTEATGVRGVPDRTRVFGGHAIARDRLRQAQPGRLLGCNPMAGADDASLETAQGAFQTAPPIETIELDRLDGDLLRRRWRSVIGRHPPKTLSPTLMVRILTWREQVACVGDVSPRSHAILAAAMRGPEERTETGGKPDGAPVKRTSLLIKPIRAGTVLVREHAGVLHRVTVTADGFEWNGRIFASLSAVARAITGISWSGRRFFGLDRSSREAGERSGPGEQNGRSPAGRPS